MTEFEKEWVDGGYAETCHSEEMKNCAEVFYLAGKASAEKVACESLEREAKLLAKCVELEAELLPLKIYHANYLREADLKVAELEVKCEELEQELAGLKTHIAEVITDFSADEKWDEVRYLKDTFSQVLKAQAGEQEPVAWLADTHEHDDPALFFDRYDAEQSGYSFVQPLFTHPTTERRVPDGWLRAMDEAMVGSHLGVADESDSYEVAKKKLNDLICWNINGILRGADKVMRLEACHNKPRPQTEAYCVYVREYRRDGSYEMGEQWIYGPNWSMCQKAKEPLPGCVGCKWLAKEDVKC